MELRQRLELKRLLIPQLQQSLKILTLSTLDLKAMVEEELVNNPFLEETAPNKKVVSKPPSSGRGLTSEELDYRLSLVTKKSSLQDVLLRQLGMFAAIDEEIRIGQEIIGNIDENGYLKATLEEIAKSLAVAPENVENALKLIQQFEPAGVGARTISECLLIQLELANEKDPLLMKIVGFHLEDVAKKNYTLIAKALKEPQEKIEPLIKKILKLDPKPGRNYSSEEIQHVIPDIIINEKDEDLELTINNEDIPDLDISQTYKDMLKDVNLDPATKEFLTQKMRNALEFLRAISKRQTTLRRIVETIVEVQQDAIRNNLSHLKPLTLQDVAQKIEMHESTVCRAIMNKYVKLPYGVVALKDFFSSRIHNQSGEALSSNHIRKLLKDYIGKEDKKHPLSDQEISRLLLNEKNLKVPRRTVAKYREELRILSSSFRRER